MNGVLKDEGAKKEKTERWLGMCWCEEWMEQISYMIHRFYKKT